MKNELQTPFESIEGAQEYMRLLQDTIGDARQEVATDIGTHTDPNARRLQALRIVSYKLAKLEEHMKSSRRILNDLRTLRRLLFEERRQPAPTAASADKVQDEAPEELYESDRCW